MATIQFDAGASTGRRAIVVSFDLCGFSNFCNHPEAHANLPKFISAVFDELDSVLIGAFEEFWEGLDTQKGQAPAPDFIKYTGDGALMIWFPPDDTESRQKYGTAIVAAMRRFRQSLTEIVSKWEIEWQVDRLPQPARFGIATGLVYPLKPKSIMPDFNDPIDYAGYCINLAVRLQDHCPEIGFIVHELVFPKLEGMWKYIAHGMKGTRSEPVLMFVSDIPEMTVDYHKSKFLPCGHEPELRCQITQRDFKMEFKNGKGAKGNPVIVQPRFEAHLTGPDNWHRDMFVDEQHETFIFVEDIKDNTGKVIRQEKWFYKLTSKGPPLNYEFVRREPLVGVNPAIAPK
jgi:class 3 adenylate cyclase